MLKKLQLISILVLFAFSANAQWGQFQKTIPAGSLSEFPDYEYGSSVDIDGNYAVVGAKGANTSTGLAYVLYFNGTEWETQATLKASNPNSDDNFGFAVAISGNTIVVGAYGDNTEGSVYVYERPTAGWSGNNVLENARLTASNPETDEYFGRSVAIDGDVIVVGAYGDNSFRGSAYVFVKPDTGWANMTQTAKLKSSVEQDGDDFGKSVSISGDVIAIGAYQDDYTGLNNCGSVYIYEKPTDGWVSTSDYDYKKTAFDKEAEDKFGRSVAIDGNTLVVGAYGKNSDAGVAYVFEYDGSAWNSVGKLIPTDADAGDLFGISADIKGDAIIIGAYENNYGSVTKSGSAYVFNKPASGWEDMNETQLIFASDYSSYDRFGLSVAITDEHISVGSYLSNASGTNSGSAYWYKYCTPTAATIIREACETYTSPSGDHTWTESGIYEDIIPNAEGCDSVITINLTINQPTASNVTITACDSYESPSGNYTWVSSGTYQDIIPNENGCDSVITFNLTIEENNIVTTVTQTNEILVSDQNGADEYQWIDCDNGNAEISGATSQSYTATSNGNYAVIITMGSCSSTSDCYTVSTLDVNSINNTNIEVFPNPVSSVLFFNNLRNNTTITVSDILGKTVFSQSVNVKNNSIDVSNLNKGIYILSWNIGNKKYNQKIIKN